MPIILAEEERIDPTQGPTGLKAENFIGQHRLALIGQRIKRARESLGVTQGVTFAQSIVDAVDDLEGCSRDTTCV